MCYCDIIFNGLTALGTVGACVISLFLAYSRYRHKLDCVFIWAPANEYKPTLFVKNLCRRMIIIRTMDIFYGKEKVATFNLNEDYHMFNYAIVPAESEKSILFDANKFDSSKLGHTANQHKRKTLKIIVRTFSGKKFVSKQKYSYREIESLLFGYSFFRNA